MQSVTYLFVLGLVASMSILPSAHGSQILRRGSYHPSSDYPNYIALTKRTILRRAEPPTTPFPSPPGPQDEEPFVDGGDEGDDEGDNDDDDEGDNDEGDDKDEKHGNDFQIVRREVEGEGGNDTDEEDNGPGGAVVKNDIDTAHPARLYRRTEGDLPDEENEPTDEDSDLDVDHAIVEDEGDGTDGDETNDHTVGPGHVHDSIPPA